jgi:YesN/AraC family two-component response regulator
MCPANFLWLDFRRNLSTPGLFHLLLPGHDVRNLEHPCDATPYIQACPPYFLCFEFDFPNASDLAVLQQTKRQHPELPLLMITESHSESLAVWAFRSGVWDYLVKPLTAGDLNRRIETLAHLCLERPPGDLRLPRHASLPCSVQLETPREISQGHKTLLARQFVESHFAESVRLSVVAMHCHMSESEFSRVFKKEHGHTFCEYLLKFRISKACESLADPSVQVKTVAFDVGFNDVSYFARTFRRYTGATPSSYQQVLAMKIPASFHSSQPAATLSNPI